MSEGTSRNLSKSISEGVSGKDVAVGTTSSLYEENANNTDARPRPGWQPAPRSTYEHLLVIFNYIIFFLSRLGKDLFQSVMCYFYSERVLPYHITDLIRVQQRLCAERISSSNRYNVIINRASLVERRSPAVPFLSKNNVSSSTRSYH